MQTKISVLLSLFCLVFFLPIISQNKGVVITDKTNQTVHDSAVLEIISNDKGFLLPRMETTDRNDIDNPAESLIIFNKESKCFDIYIDAEWHEIWYAGVLYSLSLDVYPIGGGDVNGEGLYPQGEIIEISAIPEVDFEFINWTGDITYVDNPDQEITNVTMPAEDITITANFEYTPDDPSDCGDPILYEGQYYSTVEIGSQCWFAENLNVGTRVDIAEEQGSDCNNIKKYCYNNQIDSCNNYGAHYRWNMATCGEGSEPENDICPDGWRLPTDDDWKILEEELSMDPADLDLVEWERGTNEGSKLATNAQLWGEEEVIVTTPGFDESGFNALPTGFIMPNISANFGRDCSWWTSSKEEGESRWRRRIDREESTISRDNQYPITYSRTVRCVKE